MTDGRKAGRFSRENSESSQHGVWLGWGLARGIVDSVGRQFWPAALFWTRKFVDVFRVV